MFQFRTMLVPEEMFRFLETKEGTKRFAALFEFLNMWGILADELGREPTREDFMEYWGESRATWYRRLLLWRGLWPEDDNPQRVYEGRVEVERQEQAR